MPPVALERKALSGGIEKQHAQADVKSLLNECQQQESGQERG